MAGAKIGVYLRAVISHHLTFPHGPVAQLIERFVRNEEVVGLIPIGSTNPRLREVFPRTARWPVQDTRKMN